MLVFSKIVLCLILKNEVDGDAFLALTEDMIKSLIEVALDTDVISLH